MTQWQAYATGLRLLAYTTQREVLGFSFGLGQGPTVWGLHVHRLFCFPLLSNREKSEFSDQCSYTVLNLELVLRCHVGCSLLLRDQLSAGNKSHLVDMVWVICFGVGSSCVLLPLHTSPFTCVPTGMFPSCVSVLQICSLRFSGLFYITLDLFSPLCCQFVLPALLLLVILILDLGHQH